MRAFDYRRAASIDDAIAAADRPDTRLLAGGTNLVDLMKGYVEQPVHLVDIGRLPLADITPLPDGGVRIGALARNSDVANDRVIRERYPLLAEALLAGASPQLRNMATVGGNLMQRTRCHYFYDTAFGACNKRVPGSGCAALEGFTRQHAIFGASDKCIATHPSDMAVAMTALDAVVLVRSVRGQRRISIGDFHRLPAMTPERDTNLVHGEVIVAVDLPPSAFAAHSYYLKVRDRASYAFALVSVAAALAMRDGVVSDARIVLGGVAHKPWRVQRAEQQLVNHPLDPASIDAAAQTAVTGAQPVRDNAFKVTLARNAVARAVRNAGGTA